MSSDSVPVPVEASIEDLHNIQAPQQCIQSDAQAGPLDLEEKLNQELHYHQHGNYTTHSTNDYLNSSFSPFLCRHNAGTVLEQDRLPHTSSVHSFTKAEPVHPTSQDNRLCNPTGDQSLLGTSPAYSKTPLSSSCSAPFLPQFNQEHPHSLYNRQQSWPTFPATDTSAPASLLASSKSRVLQDSGARSSPCARPDGPSVNRFNPSAACVCSAQGPFTFTVPKGSRSETTTR